MLNGLDVISDRRQFQITVPSIDPITKLGQSSIAVRLSAPVTEPGYLEIRGSFDGFRAVIATIPLVPGKAEYAAHFQVPTTAEPQSFRVTAGGAGAGGVEFANVALTGALRIFRAPQIGELPINQSSSALRFFPSTPPQAAGGAVVLRDVARVE
jgi:hypothetical protein